MRAGPVATVGLLLSLALLIPACGDQGSAASAEKTQTISREARAPVNTRARVSVTAKRCRRALGELLDSMESLANTLAVGLDYEAYLGSVNRVRATYADVGAKSLSLPCLGLAAGPAERALNLYIAAVNTWGDCLATPACDPASVEPQLQRRWDDAGDSLASAQRGLRSVGR